MFWHRFADFFHLPAGGEQHEATLKPKHQFGKEFDNLRRMFFMIGWNRAHTGDEQHTVVLVIKRAAGQQGRRIGWKTGLLHECVKLTEGADSCRGHNRGVSLCPELRLKVFARIHRAAINHHFGTALSTADVNPPGHRHTGDGFIPAV